MKNIVYIIAVVAIALIAFAIFRPKPAAQTNQQTKSPQSQSEPATESSTESTVNYTDQGFNPSSLTVKSGTTVTFINQSSNPMWVASDPHPTHTKLPKFDGLKNIPKGGSYQFTFTKTGTWGYHNHLAPADLGRIIVQ